VRCLFTDSAANTDEQSKDTPSSAHPGAPEAALPAGSSTAAARQTYLGPDPRDALFGSGAGGGAGAAPPQGAAAEGAAAEALGARSPTPFLPPDAGVTAAAAAAAAAAYTHPPDDSHKDEEDWRGDAGPSGSGGHGAAGWGAGAPGEPGGGAGRVRQQGAAAGGWRGGGISLADAAYAAAVRELAERGSAQVPQKSPVSPVKEPCFLKRALLITGADRRRRGCWA